jgi:hypothetical protein
MPPDELYSARDLLLEMRQDVKSLLEAHAQTTERLAGGAKHFSEIDEELKKHEKEILAVAGRKCPRFPKPSLVYAMITVGFTILCILVSMKAGA